MTVEIAKVPTHLAAGLHRTIWVPATNGIADIHKPTVAELEKDGNIDLSIYLGSHDAFNLDHSQETFNDEREAYAVAGKINGMEKYENGKLHVIDNTNTKDATQYNEAIKALTKGARGFFVRRRGKKASEEFAAGDVVSVFPATIGLKTAFKDNRQMSLINFAADPSSSDEESVVVAAAGVTTTSSAVVSSSPQQ
ncbi:hypothetical protein ACJV45_00735 [Gardnerella sp. Marseille-Q9181]|uniref:phage tail tube protein n=1 Tax=Gardnerella sp. Marseille-Q9181 TaxID=3383029 RepID=UPI003AF83C45